MRSPSRQNAKRELWIIKAGSQMVIEGGPRLISDWMRQACLLNSKFGVDVIWVTSGAIATARIAASSNRKIKKYPRGKTPLAEKQALSALGQPMVMEVYKSALAKQNRLCSQVLLTSDDLAHKSRRTNLTRTLATLLSWDVMPILNENDAVSTEEIQFGDNDKLSALVARAMGAKRLLLLTDVDGLFDSDPKKNPGAQKIQSLSRVSSTLIKTLSGTSTGVGTGGMLSKILAARLANKASITTHLVRGSLPDAILKIAFGATNDYLNEIPGTTIGDFNRSKV